MGLLILMRTDSATHYARLRPQQPGQDPIPQPVPKKSATARDSAGVETCRTGSCAIDFEVSQARAQTTHTPIDQTTHLHARRVRRAEIHQLDL
ncbi:MAG TPA: hypothetical protein VGO18_13915, partial [Steroidobacteraceae bacterium]|nr:hypothetical protein [Steroidobacteraceae bacterium]